MTLTMEQTRARYRGVNTRGKKNLKKIFFSQQKRINLG